MNSTGPPSIGDTHGDFPWDQSVTHGGGVRRDDNCCMKAQIAFSLAAELAMANFPPLVSKGFLQSQSLSYGRQKIVIASGAKHSFPQRA